MPSALFQIDPGTGSYGSSGVAQDAAAAVTVNCRITSLVGVDSIEWRIFGTHGVTAPTITLSGAPNGQIASFTLGTAANNPNGQGYGIECKVNGGTSRFNPQGHTATSAVYVLAPTGKRPVWIGETFEADAAYGVVSRVVELLAAAGTNVSGTAAGGGTTDLTTVAVATAQDKIAIEAEVFAEDQTTGDSAFYHSKAAFKNVAGTVTQLGGVDTDGTLLCVAEDDAAWPGITYIISGTNVIVRFGGDAANSTTARGTVRIRRMNF